MQTLQIERRFIPAGAGNSPSTLIAALVIPVYPRWRGELMKCRNVNFSSGGLSPLARGTRSNKFTNQIKFRFIPAGAGNSFPLSVSADAVPVYPRWRGELDWLSGCVTRAVGLSPLARGTLTEPRPYVMQIRFIPAGAGNSRRRRSGWPSPAVYPRWRGELSAPGRCIFWDSGLSPLARGTLMQPVHQWRERRFIPAGAGNSAVSVPINDK